jgi:sugar phosphate isomerase/epimerase
MTDSLQLAYHVWSGSLGDFETCYREVAQAGIGSIVLTAVRGNLDLRKPEDLAAAGRILNDLGLSAPACHCQDWANCDLNEPDPDLHSAMIHTHLRLMQHVVQLGAKTFVLHLGHKPKDAPPQAGWDLVRNAVDALAQCAEGLGMLLALENGLPGYQATNEELLSFVSEYDHPAVGICYDSGHAHITGDAAGVLRELSPYVVTVHLHDNDGTADQHLLPGQGTINWPPVAKALARCPRLLHLETEAANCTQWPHTPEVLSYRDAYARYLAVLNLPGGDGR